VALAFASGSLITMLAFDLFEELFKAGGEWFSGIGFLGGAASYVATDGLLDRYIDDAVGSVSGFFILAAVTLDGVSERRWLSAPPCGKDPEVWRPGPYWRLRDPRLGGRCLALGGLRSRR
jgi:ZIP family zinc transporter